jgi:hypothetical protein
VLTLEFGLLKAGVFVKLSASAWKRRLTDSFKLNLRERPPLRAATPVCADRHEMPRDSRVLAKSILGGLHHDYALS